VKPGWHLLAFCLLAAAFDATQDLLEAARRGDPSAVKAALEQNGQLESKTRHGQTPLFLAAANGHVEAVQLLLDKGAKVDVKDTFYNTTAIAVAAGRKHVAVVKLLLARSTDFDRNLDSVVSLRNPELVAAVLAAGRPSQGALDRGLERASRDAEIAALLRAAGAQPPSSGARVDARVLESYAGVYRSEAAPYTIKVSARDGRLYVQATGQAEFAPRAKSATTFEYAQGRIELAFGAPGALVLRKAGQTLHFRRVGSE
jgi:Ankyrin repeats (3 copies)